MQKALYEKHSDAIDYIYFKRNIFEDQSLNDVGPPQFHNAVEFKLITKGIYRYMLSGKEEVANAGELVVIAPKAIHLNIPVKNTEYYTLVVNISFLETVCGRHRGFPKLIKNSESVHKQLENSALYASEHWKTFDERKKKGFVYHFIGMLAEFYDTVDFGISEVEHKLGEILQYIQGHYAENLTLEMLAREFGYVPSYFSALFKKYMNINFRDYLNRYRIDVACRLVREDKALPLWLVAEKSGFQSYVTFYRACKKYAPKLLCGQTKQR